MRASRRRPRRPHEGLRTRLPLDPSWLRTDEDERRAFGEKVSAEMRLLRNGGVMGDAELIHRAKAWTCFAQEKGRLKRCEHLNANGGVPVPYTDFAGRQRTRWTCEKCGADFTLHTHDAQSEHDESGLSRRAKASEIVKAFERAERVVRECAAVIEREQQAMAELLGESFSIGSIGNRSIDATLVSMRQQTWDAIATRLGIRQIMSIRAAMDFDRETRSNEPPPITEEAIARWSSHMLASMTAMHEEAVVEVFDWLRPRSDYGMGKLKTNNKFRLGEKVVVGWMVEQAFARAGYYAVRWDSQKQLTALENVFSALDGQGMANKSGWSSTIEEAITAAPGGVGETDYFAFKCFRNGNLHLRFKRPDLVARINQIAGSRSLAPSSED